MLQLAQHVAQLQENIKQRDMQDLKANHERKCAVLSAEHKRDCEVLEAKLDSAKGTWGSALTNAGWLALGLIFVMTSASCNALNNGGDYSAALDL